jgi:hypothetical protein
MATGFEDWRARGSISAGAGGPLGERGALGLFGVPGGFHGGRDLVEPVVEEVPVGVECHRGGGVPEHLLDDLDVRS